MIKGIGVDTVEIERFRNWHLYPKKRLLRLFTPREIDYCLSNEIVSAERFAARFAVKEAAFKAWSQATGEGAFPFFTWCTEVEFVEHAITITRAQKSGWHAHCSVSHSKTMAVALVIVESA